MSTDEEPLAADPPADTWRTVGPFWEPGKGQTSSVSWGPAADATDREGYVTVTLTPTGIPSVTIEGPVFVLPDRPAPKRRKGRHRG